MILVSARRIEEAHENLIQRHVVQHHDPGFCAEHLGKAAGVCAAPLDNLLDAVPAERCEGGIDRHASRSSRKLRVPIDGIAIGAGCGLHEVCGGGRHRCAVRRVMAADHDAGVIRNVQPLVGIGRPRVGLVEANQSCGVPARACPQPDRPVNVQPCAEGVGDRGELADRVDGSRVDVARLTTHDDRPIRREQQDPFEIGGQHRSVGIDGDVFDRPSAEPKQSCRTRNGHVDLFADDQADGWSAGEPVGLDIPACSGQYVVTGGSERCRVGHLPAGDETER